MKLWACRVPLPWTPKPRSRRSLGLALSLGVAIAGLSLLAIAPISMAQTVGEQGIMSAYQTRTSDLWVEATGRVERVLADDLEGSRHQRFILRLPSGHTLLVSHNIDLAPRIPTLAPGDTVGFRGEYEWNAQGGVIHWTHHDPNGQHPGGWLDHQGQRYQ